MTLTLRAATTDDYDALLPLFLELRRFSRERHPPQTDDFALVLAASRDYLRTVLERSEDACTLLALAGEAVAGYVVVTVHAPNLLTTSGAVRGGSIDELFIDDQQRGSGAGRLLLEAAFAWLREQGAQRVEVGAYAWNEDAIAFYGRHGFRPWTVTLARPLE